MIKFLIKNDIESKNFYECFVGVNNYDVISFVGVNSYDVISFVGVKSYDVISNH